MGCDGKNSEFGHLRDIAFGRVVRQAHHERLRGYGGTFS